MVSKSAPKLETKTSKSLIHPFVVREKIMASQLIHIKDVNIDVVTAMRRTYGHRNSLIKSMQKATLLNC